MPSASSGDRATAARCTCTTRQSAAWAASPAGSTGCRSPASRLHAKGEQIHVAAWPEVGDPELHRFATRHYAFEGRCFALCVMGAQLRPEDLPADFELREAMGASDDFVAASGGGTCIFAPDGTVVADSVAGEETIVYAELDLGRIAEEQAALDVVGHYNRPDVFSFSVDERPHAPVDWVQEEVAS